MSISQKILRVGVMKIGKWTSECDFGQDFDIDLEAISNYAKISEMKIMRN